MKRPESKLTWMAAAIMGIVLTAGATLGTMEYLRIQERIHSQEVLNVMLDRIYFDERVGLVLKQIRQGETGAAAHALDMALCGDIIRLDSELASRDQLSRRLVRDGFAQLARLRPKVAVPTDSDQLAAQKILAVAVKTASAR